MPEIKNQFSRGKMNKDLDERLVPNGEYRDAMNIQVSTSEGADVGTIQNILGNKLISNENLSMPAGAIVVGSVADEANDVFYYFVYTPSANYIMSYKSGAQNTEFVFIDNNLDVLKFDPNHLITGINIIDDLLLWTDGHTEPKKINVPRSIAGTFFPASTLLIDENGNWILNPNYTGTPPNDQLFLPVEEKHITVIKKAPSKPPKITKVISQGADGVTDVIDFIDVNGVSLLNENDTISIIINNDSTNIEDGQIIRLNPDDLNQAASEKYLVRVLVDEITIVGNDTVLDVTILTLSPKVTLGSKKYKFAVEDSGRNLFERKFPRFAYRYKYVDNEYSSVGPFSEVVFIPGSFRYHPTEAFNKGMVNTLKELTLQDFIPLDIPEDVIQVELLYKNEVASNIYIIKSISKDDTLEDDGYNAWTSPGSRPGLHGSYKVATENIYAQLPSNQIIRPWDNVPKKALAQEMVGNRVVYANYTQGYNLNGVGGGKITPIINTRLKVRDQNTENIGQKSIKSLRTYNVGIVYGDEYGRETPVFTHSSASQVVPKTQATSSNLLDISVNSEHPIWADYYKIFIKETSNEYYNLAMDRLYDAEDGNVWISFPSIDRNKVDEDTYLILKKGIDNNEAIYEEARYKIVAIENEAPDYIKTTLTLLAEPNLPINGYTIIGGQAGVPNAVFNPPEEPPHPGHVSFSIRKTIWNAGFSPTASHMGLSDLVGLFEDKGTNRMYVSFSNNVVVSLPNTPQVLEKRESEKYLITSIDLCDNQASPPCAGNTGSPLYIIHLNKPIPDTDSWITDNIDEDFVDGGQLKPRFYKEEVINKPEFDGRFFVKIEDDDIVKDNLISSFPVKDNYVVEVFANIYNLSDANAPVSTNITSSMLTGTALFISGSATFASFDDDWYENLKFGTDDVQREWFIDHISYAAEQLDGTYNIRWAEHTFNGVSSHDPNTGYSTGNVFREGFGGATDLDNDGYASGYDFFTLAYSKLGPYFEWPDIPMYSPGVPKNWIPSDGFMPAWTAGSDESEKAEVVKKLKAGQKFRFRGDDTIYTIEQAVKRRLYNHSVPPSDTVGGTYTGATTVWGNAVNKRISYTIKYTVDDSSTIPPTATNTVPNNLGLTSNTGTGAVISGTVPGQIEFVRPYTSDAPNVISDNPAIFETEPKEDVGIDIYYEATGKIPISITNKNKHLFIPIGATISVVSGTSVIPDGTFVVGWSDDQVELSNDFTSIGAGKLKFTDDDGGYMIANYDGSTVNFINITPAGQMGLAWFNCWSFNNGVESNRIGDTYNKPYITNGVKASTTLDEAYEEEDRKYGLIYSGLYNSTSGVNNLNQFIAAEKITKDINPRHGSIQKLHTRDTDLITLCEDKILKILADKDALYNADGSSQLTSTNNVLGQTIPFSGEFGISKNPESFASENYRVYFTDKVRGVVMRLSRDGLTPISNHGMRDWFRDNLKLNTTLIGSYDDRQKEYNITLKDTENTVSFREDVKGWVSFKSFTPENAISCANEYYTFNGGEIWLHNTEDVDRNTFYDGSDNFTSSKFSVILNNTPGSIKSFNTLNYEGSQSKVQQDLQDNQYYNLGNKPGWFVSSIVTDLEKGSLNEFIDKEGKWFNYLKGQNVITDNNGLIVVNPDGSSSFDQSSFAIQGIGVASSIFCPDCPEVTSWNCVPQNGGGRNDSCEGMTIFASSTELMEYAWLPANHNTLLNNIGITPGDCAEYGGAGGPYNRCYVNGVDDTNGCYKKIGSVSYNAPAWASSFPQYVIPTQASIALLLQTYIDLGLNLTLTSTFTEFKTELGNAVGVNLNNMNISSSGSIGYCVCTSDSPSGIACIEVAGTGGDYQTKLECERYCGGNGNEVNGCTDPTAVNYNPNATSDDGSCIDCIYGCMQAQGSINYNPLATCDDGSCIPFIFGCTDSRATNYDPTANTDDGSCEYEIVPATCGNIFTSGALEGCDDFLCLLYPNIDALTCTGQAFPSAMALATYWANIITTQFNSGTSIYVDQNGIPVGAITPLEMYDLLVSCCVSPIE